MKKVIERPKTIAIIDPYSSGKLLAPEFRSRGVECIAVHTQKVIPTALVNSFNRDNFVGELHFQGDINLLAEQITHCNCTGIIPGTESGVLLADDLTSHLGLPGNNSKLSLARRNKYLMHEAIKECGIKGIYQCCSNQYEDLAKWIKENNVFPFIIKPIDSAGSDGVAKCKTIEEGKIAFEAIIGRPNLFNSINHEVLAQEYIQGEEFCVDSVSFNGIHYVTNIMSYKKGCDYAASEFVYLEEEFNHPSDPKFKNLIAYNIKILNALGIERGPSHSEIKMVDDNPVLIEIGARSHGACVPEIVQKISSISQIDLTVDVYVEPERFYSRVKKPPEFHKAALICFLTNYNKGILKGIPGADLVKTLPSYGLAHWDITIGDEIVETTNLVNSPGWVAFISEDKNQIEMDRNLLKQWGDECKLFSIS